MSYPPQNPYPPPQNPYPPPQYYPPPVPSSQTSGWAIFSLIAGLLAWLGVFGLGGLAAVIAGHIAQGQIRSSGGRMSGSGMATAGLVLGYLNLAFALVTLCISILIFTGAIAAPALCLPFMNDMQTYP